MGMFDTDKEYGNRIDQAFALGVPFVVVSAQLRDDTITTRLGESEVVEFMVHRIGADGFAEGPEFTVSTIATAIVEKAKQADDADFPAVVELRRVQSKNHKNTSALVLQFVREYAAPLPSAS